MHKRYYFLPLLLCLSWSCLGAGLDPTMPPDWTPASLIDNLSKDIVFSGSFVKNNQTIAIINNQAVSQGDFIQGYEVIRIESNSVYLKNNNGVFMIPLIINVKDNV